MELAEEHKEPDRERDIENANERSPAFQVFFCNQVEPVGLVNRISVSDVLRIQHNSITDQMFAVDGVEL